LASGRGFRSMPPQCRPNSWSPSMQRRHGPIATAQRNPGREPISRLLRHPRDARQQLPQPGGGRRGRDLRQQRRRGGISLGWHMDSDGKPLLGSNRYEVTFAASALPPVRLFWSITMYALPSRLLVANPIDRSIGDRTDGLIYAENGSLTIVFQHEKPSNSTDLANWLPAPARPPTASFASTARNSPSSTEPGTSHRWYWPGSPRARNRQAGNTARRTSRYERRLGCSIPS
jgi:hypothetical protein